MSVLGTLYNLFWKVITFSNNLCSLNLGYSQSKLYLLCIYQQPNCKNWLLKLEQESFRQVCSSYNQKMQTILYDVCHFVKPNGDICQESFGRLTYYWHNFWHILHVCFGFHPVSWLHRSSSGWKFHQGNCWWRNQTKCISFDWLSTN